MKPVIQAAGGYYHTLFLVNENGGNYVYGCGYNALGTLGIGSVTSPIMTPTLAASGSSSYPWNGNTASLWISGHPEHHSFVLDDQGNLYGAGSNQHGQLCQSQSTTSSNNPMQVQASQLNVTQASIQSVALGRQHTVFTANIQTSSSAINGALYTCGRNHVRRR